jgi:hypothetical protein
MPTLNASLITDKDDTTGRIKESLDIRIKSDKLSSVYNIQQDLYLPSITCFTGHIRLNKKQWRLG